ncbi:hypothetical protein O6H91_03G120900 [Diphasiastrum complanatum]|uniref:Uncharacterized protein n=2 Tax=Diphasiastrum complanatum TaxID=34168 RepID=A0ACC2AFM9_DIPCM|nr:hypothetical protein O6H91_22G056600 [Diphasiastrum complanatum]KAJ7563684.1 hypothetical protein O6H91_03G120900 [Diphasiastrum complanatum]
MKFQVCGGLDAPDWILAEISTLSKISSVQIKVLAVQIIQRILDGNFDYDNLWKLTTDSSIGISDAKACVAALHFFLSNAARFDVDDGILSRELQQLGLPKEHSDYLCRPYEENKSALQTKFLHETLQVPSLKIAGWETQSGEPGSIILHMNEVEKGASNGHDILLSLTYEKFHLLLKELKIARSLMEDVS